MFRYSKAAFISIWMMLASLTCFYLSINSIGFNRNSLLVLCIGGFVLNILPMVIISNYVIKRFFPDKKKKKRQLID